MSNERTWVEHGVHHLRRITRNQWRSIRRQGEVFAPTRVVTRRRNQSRHLLNVALVWLLMHVKDIGAVATFGVACQFGTLATTPMGAFEFQRLYVLLRRQLLGLERIFAAF